MDPATDHQLVAQLLTCYDQQLTVIDYQCLPSRSSQLNPSRQLQASLAANHCFYTTEMVAAQVAWLQF